MPGADRFCPGPGRLLTFPLVAPLAQLAEQVTLNHWVRGSSPWRRTKFAGQEPGPLRPGSSAVHETPTVDSGGLGVRAPSRIVAGSTLTGLGTRVPDQWPARARCGRP